jgi:hypothetical protein
MTSLSAKWSREKILHYEMNSKQEAKNCSCGVVAVMRFYGSFGGRKADSIYSEFCGKVRIRLSMILHRLEENFLSKVYVINLRNRVCSSLSRYRSSSIGITIRLRVGDATFELALT